MRALLKSGIPSAHGTLDVDRFSLRANEPRLSAEGRLDSLTTATRARHEHQRQSGVSRRELRVIALWANGATTQDLVAKLGVEKPWC
jgi:hypothetical protein